MDVGVSQKIGGVCGTVASLIGLYEIYGSQKWKLIENYEFFSTSYQIYKKWIH